MHQFACCEKNFGFGGGHTLQTQKQASRVANQTQYINLSSAINCCTSARKHQLFVNVLLRNGGVPVFKYKLKRQKHNNKFMPSQEDIQFAADIIFKKYDEGHAGILHADEIYHLIEDAHVYLGIKTKVKETQLWGFIRKLHPQKGGYVTPEDLYLVMKQVMKVD